MASPFCDRKLNLSVEDAEEDASIKLSLSDDVEDGDLKLNVSLNDAKEYDFEDVSQKSRSVSLKSGLDFSDDRGEILREEAGSANEICLSPVFPRKKLSGGFRLTPRLQELGTKSQNVTGTEVDVEKLDLTTPQCGLTANLGANCPDRPLKGRRSMNVPAVEKSCRHLFTGDKEVSSGSTKEAFTSDKITELQDHNQSQPREKSQDFVIEEKKQAGKENEDNYLETVTFTPENRKILSRFSSSSHSVCSKSSCSVSSCSSSESDLSSPNLSEIKAMKRTIESSSGEIEKLVVEEAINDFPDDNEDLDEACEEPNEPKHLKNDVFIGPSSPSLKAATGSGNINRAQNTFTSSIGSGPSNWTVVSGVSPLPSSDPTHLRHRHFIFGHPYHHHHHHNHHHRHHHHHHHHHNHHNKNKNHDHLTSTKGSHNLSHSKIMITSTPIRVENNEKFLDISDIKTSQRSGSLPLQFEVSRFVLSNELQFTSDDPSEIDDVSIEVEEPKMPSAMTLQEENKEDKEHISSPKSVVNDKKRQHLQEEVANVLEPCMKFFKQGNPRLTVDVTYEELTKDAGRTPFVRRLTKKEVEILKEKPVNLTDDVWEKLPSPRRHSPVNESLSQLLNRGSPILSFNNTK